MLSILSFELFVRSQNFGALNLYSDESSVYDEVARVVGSVLAQHASVAMAASTADEQWRRALRTRDLIGQAKGLLMQRNVVSGEHAFEMMKDASQRENVKLHEIAQWLVDQHDSTATPAPPPRRT